MVVQIPGKKLLAGTRFACDQYIAVSGSDLTRHVQQLLHFTILGDDAHLALETLDLFAQGAVLPAQANFFHRLRHHFAHLVESKGLGNIVEGALLHRVHCRFEGGITCDEDDLGVGTVSPAFFQDLQAVHFLHAQVGEDDVELLLVQVGQRVGAALGGGDLVAFLLHHVFEVLHGDLFVVHDQ